MDYYWVNQWKVTRDGRTILEYGTPVLVFGAYAWDSLPPWRRLGQDPLAATLRPGELENALAADLPTILARRPPAESLGHR